jgi:predicted porin
MNLKKTLVAMAVAGFVASPVASYAAATMYGAIELGLQQTGKKADNGKSSTDYFDNGSRIGFKGSNALGNGLTGIYTLELGVDALNGNTAETGPYAESKGQIKTRLGYMGVKGSYGTVLAGRMHGLFYSFIEQPTDTPNVLAGPLNPIGFADQVGGALQTAGLTNLSSTSKAALATSVGGVGGLGGYKSRVNAVAYVSPDMGGFTGGVAYADIGTYNNAGDSQNGKQQGVYQIGGKYTFGSAYVGVAYMGIPQDNVRYGFMQNVIGLSAGYNFGMFAIDGNYQQAKPRTSGPLALPGDNNNKNVQSAAIQGSMTMGPLYAYVQYSQMKWKYLSNKTAQRTTAGVFYNIAKPLQVTFEVASNNKYVSGMMLNPSNNTNKSYTTFAVGANYMF